MSLPKVILDDIEELGDDEKADILKQIESLTSLRELKSAVRDFKMKLDLPELTDEERKPIPEVEFEKVQGYVMLLVETTEEIDLMDLSLIRPEAKDYLLSQVKKSIGHLIRILERGTKS